MFLAIFGQLTPAGTAWFYCASLGLATSCQDTHIQQLLAILNQPRPQELLPEKHFISGNLRWDLQR